MRGRVGGGDRAPGPSNAPVGPPQLTTENMVLGLLSISPPSWRGEGGKRVAVGSCLPARFSALPACRLAVRIPKVEFGAEREKERDLHSSWARAQVFRWVVERGREPDDGRRDRGRGKPEEVCLAGAGVSGDAQARDPSVCPSVRVREWGAFAEP